MHVVVAGGSGFIGKALIEELQAAGHRVSVLTRGDTAAQRGLGSGVAASAWSELPHALRGVDAVVNLAGESIAGGRWTPARKQRILESRLRTTQALVEAMTKVEPRPRVLVTASAVGYYGDRATPVDESAAPGSDFLAGVCSQWEAAAQQADELGVRVVRLRIGVVLGKGGGALPRMLLPFKLFAGGPVGSGRQGFPWVHLADVVGLIRWALETPHVAGALNAVAPVQQNGAEFARALGQVMGRPSWLPVPGFALRAGLGEMADLLLTGQFVVPAVAQRLGYRFRFPEVAAALRNVLD